MIVKIQRPLNASVNDELNAARIYNQTRDYDVMVAYSDVAHLFKDGSEKIYHFAKVSKTQGLKPIDMKQFNFQANISLQTGETTTNKRLSKKRIIIRRRLPEQPW